MLKESCNDAYIKMASEITPAGSIAAGKLIVAANELESKGRSPTGNLQDTQLYCLQWLVSGWFSCTGPFMCLQYQEIGLSETQLGAVFLVGGLVAQVLSPSVGFLTDRAAVIFGQRARFVSIAICVLLNTVGYLLSFWPLPGVPLLLQTLLCRILIETKSSAVAIFDAITLRVMKDRYGKARSYGASSYAVTCIICGALWDNFGFRAMQCWILVMTVSLYLALLCVGSPPAEHSKGAGHDPSATLCAMIRNYGNDHTKLTFFALACSIQSCLIMPRNLIFLYFRKMQLSYTLCGSSVFSSVIIEIPMLFHSDKVLACFGPQRMLILAGISAVFRMACYIFVSGGAWVLLIEPLHGMIFTLFKVPNMKILHSMTPSALQASGQSFFSMVINAAGAFAILISSYTIASFGEIMNFAGASVVTALTLGMYTASMLMHSPRQ